MGFFKTNFVVTWKRLVFCDICITWSHFMLFPFYRLLLGCKLRLARVPLVGRLVSHLSLIQRWKVFLISTQTRITMPAAESTRVSLTPGSGLEPETPLADDFQWLEGAYDIEDFLRVYDLPQIVKVCTRQSLNSPINFHWIWQWWRLFDKRVLCNFISLTFDFITHWGLDKMATILQMSFSNPFSAGKSFVFWFT